MIFSNFQKGFFLWTLHFKVVEILISIFFSNHVIEILMNNGNKILFAQQIVQSGSFFTAFLLPMTYFIWESKLKSFFKISIYNSHFWSWVVGEEIFHSFFQQVDGYFFKLRNNIFSRLTLNIILIQLFWDFFYK